MLRSATCWASLLGSGSSSHLAPSRTYSLSASSSRSVSTWHESTLAAPEVRSPAVYSGPRTMPVVFLGCTDEIILWCCCICSPSINAVTAPALPCGASCGQPCAPLRARPSSMQTGPAACGAPASPPGSRTPSRKTGPCWFGGPPPAGTSRQDADDKVNPWHRGTYLEDVVRNDFWANHVTFLHEAEIKGGQSAASP